jgi:hypothetical protein
VRVVNNWNAIPSDARAMTNSERYQKKYEQLRATPDEQA